MTTFVPPWFGRERAPASDPPRYLTHYTRSIDSVIGILTNGFAWAPRERRLMGLFPKRVQKRLGFGSVEPEQFGMICFSAAQGAAARKMRRRFGGFEIQVPLDWVKSRSGRPVTYLCTWSLDFVRRRLTNGRALATFESDIRAKYPDYAATEIISRTLDMLDEVQPKS